MESDFSHGLINGIEVLMNVTMTCFLSYPLIIERNSSVHGDAEVGAARAARGEAPPFSQPPQLNMP